MTKADHDLLIRIDQNVQTLLRDKADQETRIRKLERSRWLHSGALMIIAPLLAKLGLPIPSFGGH